MEHTSLTLLEKSQRFVSRLCSLRSWYTRAGSTRSWSHFDEEEASDEDDRTPLLLNADSAKTSAWQRRYSSIVKTCLSTRLSEVRARPWRRRSFTLGRFSTISTYLLITLILTLPVSSMPLGDGLSDTLVRRQAVPDQFGNTGNDPAPVAPQLPPQVAISTCPSLSVVSMTLTTSRELATSAIPPSTASMTLSTSEVSSSPAPPLATTFVTSTTSPFPAPPTLVPESQLEQTTFAGPVTPAILAGIVVGSSILIALLIGIAVLLRRRKQAREVAEIPIQRSKIRSRLGLRIFGSHYDDRISSTSRGGEKFTERSISSIGSTRRDMDADTNQPANGPKPPISPSLYLSRRLTRTARFSTITFGSLTGLLDKSTIGRPQPAFMGTPSQLLDAPRPLFAREQDKVNDRAPWAASVTIGRDISPPRPVRPLDAEPLGRLSGMGFGLGMR